jgi:RimJ/RimL family protein N-acetyltransferase
MVATMSWSRGPAITAHSTCPVETGGASVQTLVTARLALRPFELTDAPLVEALAGDADVARTAFVPHPYPPGSAQGWIAAEREVAAQGQRYTFAIVRSADGQLVGCVLLMLAPKHSRAALGYWIGRPYWGQGYATEAAARVMAYAFEDLGLNRVAAQAMRRNRASTRVLEKVGMAHEGVLRQGIYHWGAFEDVDMYGVLQADYAARQQGQPDPPSA